jgi:hypothetical protein
MDDRWFAILKLMGVGVIAVFGWLKTYREYNETKIKIAKERSTGEESFKKLKDQVEENTKLITGIDDRCNKRISEISTRIDTTIHDFIITNKTK